MYIFLYREVRAIFTMSQRTSSAGIFRLRKVLLVTVLCILTVFAAESQQIPHFTQYMFNDYVVNPAVAGTHAYYQVRLNSRLQWVGITDAPQTNSLSVYGPHTTKDMGFGGHLYTDVAGPTSRNGIYGTYAYNIALNNDIRLSMGASAGIIQSKIDGTRITFYEPDNLQTLESVVSTFVPDASVGIYMYAPNFYAGFSAHQLFNNKLNYYENGTGLNRLRTHFYLTGGYTYAVNRDFIIEPSVILKGTMPVPLQVDLSLRTYYREMIWMGAAFRSRDAASVLIGYIHDEKFYFGYSYDISFSGIRNHNSGTHEIMLGMRFNPIKN